MGKKNPQSAKPVKSAGSKRTTHHVDALLKLSRDEQMRFLESAGAEKLLKIFQESHPADLVRVLLDLKRAVVKQLFELIAGAHKRAVAEAATLFYYKDYLTNPLPMKVNTETGIPIPNYYAILGVPREAVEQDLKAAHRLLAKAHEPDVFPPAMRKSGEERLKEINDAFQNLKTPEKRAKADRLLPNVHYLYPRRDQSWLDSVQRLIE